MGGEQAATVLTTVKADQMKNKFSDAEIAAELDKIRKPILEKYEEEGSPYYSSARLWDDGIIAISETRKVLSLSLATIYQSYDESWGQVRFGVFRM